MTDPAIAAVRARRVWDSRGRPTVEVEVETAGGHRGRGIAPAGASRGSREATDLRDGGARLGGLDVQGALANVRGRIAPLLLGRDVRDQGALDAAMVALDGTPSRGVLGGNALVATSLALLQAAAASGGRPAWAHLAATLGREPRVPLPQIQIFGGGAHAGRRTDIQDYMIVVRSAASFDEALAATAEVYHAAGRLLSQRGRLAGVADEGGWWPDFASNEAAIEALCEAIRLAGFEPGGEVAIALDVAASEFGRDGRYRLALDGAELDRDGMIARVGGWLGAFPIASVEDPLAEDDREGLAAFTAEHGHRVQVVGDDALVTSAALVAEAAAAGACNAVLLKVNQAGTVSETLDCLAAADRAGFRAIVSARSGETEDVAIAHLAVGTGAGQIKVGSIARGERTAKWNEVLRIEEVLGPGRFASGALAGSPLAGPRAPDAGGARTAGGTGST